MIKTAVLTLSLLAPTFAFASLEWTCGKAATPMSLADWSEAYMGAKPADLPLFLQDWVVTGADSDRDGMVSASEQNEVLCRFASVLKNDGLAGAALVGPDGRIDWAGYLASDQKVTGYELRYALSKVAAVWNARVISETPLNGVDVAALKDLLASGRWSISAKDMDQQEDLLGRDLTQAGRMQKELGLAYILSELQEKSGSEFAALASEYFQIALQQKNMPYLQSVSAKNQELMVAFNQVTITEVGVPGSNRFYVLHGTPVKLKPGKMPVWYQPSNQSTFLLTEGRAYPETTGIVKLLGKKLGRICTRSPQIFALGDALQMPLDSERLRNSLQTVMDELADSFLVDAPKVIVAEQLENGATAYLDSAAGTISFSRDLLQAVGREVSRPDFNRHVVFLVMQEFLHSVQHGLPDYEMNDRLYNAPHWANALYGDVGYRDYYLAQPKERDAQDLAGRFARALSEGCSAL